MRKWAREIRTTHFIDASVFWKGLLVTGQLCTLIGLVLQALRRGPDSHVSEHPLTFVH